MFTGIVQEIGQVVAVADKENARSIEVKLPLIYCFGIKLGASVAVNGCCLTVTQAQFVFPNEQGHSVALNLTDNLADLEKITPQQLQSWIPAPVDSHFAVLSFDLISTTLELTNLSKLTVGSQVNIERSMLWNSEVGGHLLSGHVDNTLTVAKVTNQDNVYQIEFAVPEQYRDYFFDKGFVAVDGVSLTISSMTEQGFTVNLIPETLARTTLAQRDIGSQVNFEIDSNTRMVVDTTKKYLAKAGVAVN